MTVADYYAADRDAQASMLRAAEQNARDGRRHLAPYPGALDEARKATRRLANRAAPTHRGAPRNA